jgi:hypothetical protein
MIKPHQHDHPTPEITARAVEAMELSGDWEAVAAVCAVSRPLLDRWLKDGQGDDASHDEASFYSCVMAARGRFTLNRLKQIRELVEEEPKVLLRIMDLDRKKKSGPAGRPKKQPVEHGENEGDRMVMDMLSQIGSRAEEEEEDDGDDD